MSEWQPAKSRKECACVILANYLWLAEKLQSPEPQILFEGEHSVCVSAEFVKVAFDLATPAVFQVEQGAVAQT